MVEELDYFKRLYKGRNRSDFTITFNGHEYKVHLAIIAIKSTYFQSLIFKDFKENDDASVNIHMDYISQEHFEHFLQVLYDFEFDPSQIVPLICLADYFQCSELKEELEEIPFYSLAPTTLNLANVTQMILPNLTLCETIELTDDELLFDILVWFTANMNSFIDMDADILSLIPLEWLRYVFGKAPLLFFKNETDRLNKALDLYSKLEHTEELVGALFEGINFFSIPLGDMLGAKYLPLYRTENEIILQKIMEQRACSLTFDELKLKNNNNWKGCATFTLEIEDYKNAAKEPLKSSAIICKDVTGELRVTKLDDTSFSIFLSIKSSSSYRKYLCSYFLCIIENDFDFQYQTEELGEECEMSEEWGYSEMNFILESCENVHFHVQIFSLELIA
jgi:hypothetical protein